MLRVLAAFATGIELLCVIRETTASGFRPQVGFFRGLDRAFPYLSVYLYILSRVDVFRFE